MDYDDAGSRCVIFVAPGFPISSKSVYSWRVCQPRSSGDFVIFVLLTMNVSFQWSNNLGEPNSRSRIFFESSVEGRKSGLRRMGLRSKSS